MNFVDPTIPFIDLHRHLDGSVRVETILDLSRRHNLPLPAWDPSNLRPFVQITEPKPSLAAFFVKFRHQTDVMVTYDACRRIAYENVEDAQREGIDYIELRFSPWFMAETHQLKPEGVVESVVDGVRIGARTFGVKVKLIGILSRTYGPEIAMKELDALLTQQQHLVAADLAGLENRFPGALFIDHFKKARDAGLHITIHAGEEGGPEAVWQAIRELGATRIGHGVNAIKDPALVDFLREQHIGLEVNLTSNVQTSSVPDYASSPLKCFLEAGLLATINTDDPGISAIDLPHEYNVAAPAAGLTMQQVYQAQHNALEIAFLSEKEKADLLREKTFKRLALR